ncbi:UrcA family protein [Phenylobacterium sp.]|jgi:UrcA family protein|uniref:UrcA family protein n=1 Tax=Phenylobacterium sp. TaxID=1871053 RepID=UPI002F3EC10F
MFRQIITSAFAASLLLAAASTAEAQVSDVQSAKVSVAGIDTNSDEGATIVLRRIRNAAGEVCGGEPSRPLDRQEKFKPCVQEVTQHAVSKLSNPHLTAALREEYTPAAATRLASTR